MASSGGIIVPIVSTFSSKGFTQAESSMKKAGKAFKAFAAVAAAAAIKVGIDGVKAAVQDQAAQEKLATTLKNVTAATDAQIASIEEQIYQTSLAVGVADDQLRPAYDRLVRSTGDLTKSQQLLDLALNISAGTGKSLDSVVQALGKAYEGSTTSLSRLGTGLDKTALATMSFDEITKSLGETFAGQAATQADTFAGRMERIKVAFSELQEEAGARFLPILEKIIGWIINEGLPAFDKFSAWFSENITPAIEKFGAFIEEYIVPAIQLFVKWVQERLVPAFQQMVGYIKEDVQPTFDNIARVFEKYEPQIKLFLGALAAVADWVITTGIPVLVVGFFQLIALTIDIIMKKVEAVLWLMEKLGMGVYETAQTTTKELKNMESGFSEMSDIQNAKLAASKSGLQGYQKEVAKTGEIATESFGSISSAATAAAAAQEKAADRIEKANDRMEAAWLASKNAAKASLAAAQAASNKVSQALQAGITKTVNAKNAFAQEIKNSILGQFTLDDAAEEAGADTGKTYIQAMLEQLNKGRDFAIKIQQLVKAGLNQTTLNELIQKGADAGGSLANEIVAGGVGAIQELNLAMAEMQWQTELAGEAVANMKYMDRIQELNHNYAVIRVLDAVKGLASPTARSFYSDLGKLSSEEIAKYKLESYLPGVGVVPENLYELKKGVNPTEQVNFYVYGALDPEAVARQIDQIMRQSANRSGNYTNFGLGSFSLAGV